VSTDPASLAARQLRPSDRADLLSALGRVIRLVSAQSVMFSLAVANHVGMHSTDIEALDFLLLHGPMTAGGLAELTGLTTGAITGVVDRLERAGFVRRARDPHDRRRVIVEPIEDRLATIASVYEPMSRAFAEVCAGYDDASLAIVLDFLTRAVEAGHEPIALLRSGES
jgi:DNA-binding MarR family transcriptional regulator